MVMHVRLWNVLRREPDGLRDDAEALYPFTALRDSIMEGRSNLYGAIGELLFAAAYPGYQHAATRDYDFCHPKHGTVDVKTKRTTAVPQRHWNCSIAETSLHQRCDHLFFVRIHENLRDAWLLGGIDTTRMLSEGVFGRKGEPDGDTGFTFKADCWNITVDRLHPPSRAFQCGECGGWERNIDGHTTDRQFCSCPFT